MENENQYFDREASAEEIIEAVYGNDKEELTPVQEACEVIDGYLNIKGDASLVALDKLRKIRDEMVQYELQRVASKNEKERAIIESTLYSLIQESRNIIRERFRPQSA